MPIDLAVPGARFPSQDAQGWNSALPQALPGKQADLDFRLIQPAPVLGRVMDGAAVPYRAAPLLSEIVGAGLPPMDVEVIHHPVNRSRPGIAAPDRLQRPANSAAERFGVGRVQCRPAWGSTAQK